MGTKRLSNVNYRLTVVVDVSLDYVYRQFTMQMYVR